MKKFKASGFVFLGIGLFAEIILDFYRGKTGFSAIYPRVYINKDPIIFWICIGIQILMASTLIILGIKNFREAK